MTLAALMLLSLAGLAGVMIWQNHRSTIEAAEARAISSAQVVAAHIEWMMEASDQALQRIDSALGDEPFSALSANIADIEQAVGNLPQGFQYSVYDETGSLRYSSVPEAVGIEVSDREYFQELSDGKRIVISPQLDERLSGEQVFVIARGMTRGGRFIGAASIALPTNALNQFWSLMELGPNSTVSVIRTDGWLVARHPQLIQTIDLSATPLFTDFLRDAHAGVYHSTRSPADGMSRIVGYRRVANWPLVATTGIERSEALYFFWTSLRAGLIIGLPLVCLLVMATVWSLRLLRADSERRLQLEHMLERNNFLMREIHHRVKNNLQAVASLVRLQPLSQERKDDMVRRIGAMVAVHEQIYGTNQFDQVDAARYIERLVVEVADGFRSDVTIETRLEPLKLAPDQAMPLGLIVNEAITNAFKHAFVGRSAGRLFVGLRAEGETARLVIEDDGPGSGPDRGSGMGTRLIDGFVQQLGGDLDISSVAGTKVAISFPLLSAANG